VCCSLSQYVAVCCNLTFAVCEAEKDRRENCTAKERFKHIYFQVQLIPRGVTFSKALSKLKARSSNGSFH